ncbi:MAG: hypothetical protein JWM71_1074 [Solirubrobacteraceae bacterium]|nr:hypothetical protein [Solirubrobacteraceae bacterium]
MIAGTGQGCFTKPPLLQKREAENRPPRPPIGSAIVTLTHVEPVPSFAREGHLYATPSGARFYVFTAGDGTSWDAASADTRPRSFGPTLIRGASSREECVQRLAAAIGATTA